MTIENITQNAELHEFFGVTATATPEVYIIDVDITDINGERYRCDYVSAPDDTYGLAPTIRAVLAQWIANGNPVTAYAPPPITSDEVDIERDRRINEGFLFGGVSYQAAPNDRENIAGASQVALEAIMNGAQPGDLYWHGGTTPFVWIATDNSLNPMDAQTMFNFGKAAMAHKQTLIFKARAIKDMDPIPADYTEDKYWS